MLASKELLKRYQNYSLQFHVNALRLAEFLQSVEAQEVLLVQRLRDREGKDRNDAREPHRSRELTSSEELTAEASQNCAP